MEGKTTMGKRKTHDEKKQGQAKQNRSLRRYQWQGGEYLAARDSWYVGGDPITREPRAGKLIHVQALRKRE